METQLLSSAACCNAYESRTMSAKELCVFFVKMQFFVKKKKKSHCSFIRRRFSDPQLRRFHRPSRTRSAPQRVEHRVWGCGQCERGSHLAKLARVVDRFLFPLAVVSYRKPVGCAKGAYPVRLEQRFMETVVFFYKIVWIYWHL